MSLLLGCGESLCSVDIYKCDAAFIQDCVKLYNKEQWAEEKPLQSILIRDSHHWENTDTCDKMIAGIKVIHFMGYFLNLRSNH